MKKFIYKGLILIILVGGFISCKKENSKAENTSRQIETPRFDNYEALNKELELLGAMSEDARRTYEIENGYKSLKTKVYEIYEQIDMENLIDKNELFIHVDSNPDYLEILTEMSGQQEYRPIYSDCRYSLIARENRMIIVGNKCIKVFDDGLVQAPIRYFNDLETHNGKTVNSMPNNKDFDVLKSNKKVIQAKSNCGTYREREVTSGNDRTRITTECYPALIQGIVPYAKADGLIRPLKRTLGVWFHAQRTINGRFTFNFAFEQNGSNFQGVPGSGETILVPINEIVNPILSYSVTRSYSLPTGGFYPANYRFSSINSFGNTPSTSSATIICN